MADTHGTPAASTATPGAAASPAAKMGMIELVRWLFGELRTLEGFVRDELHQTGAYAAQLFGRLWDERDRLTGLFRRRNFVVMAVLIVFWQAWSLQNAFMIDFIWKEALCWALPLVWAIAVYVAFEAIFATLHFITELPDKAFKSDIFDTDGAIRSRITPLIRAVVKGLILLFIVRTLDHSWPSLMMALVLAAGSLYAAMAANEHDFRRAAHVNFPNFLVRTDAGLAVNTMKFAVRPIRVALGIGLLAHMVFNVYVRTYDVHHGDGFVALNAQGSETAWTATFDAPADGDGAKDDAIVMSIMDDVGQMAFGKTHWLPGDALTKGIANMSTVTCYDRANRALQKVCIDVLASTGVRESEVINVFGRDSCWDADGKHPSLACMKAMQKDEIMANLAVSRLNISTDPNCWTAGTGPSALRDACKKELTKYRMRLKRVDIVKTRSFANLFKHPWHMIASLWYTGYLEVEAWDRGMKKPFARFNSYYHDHSKQDLKTELQAFMGPVKSESKDARLAEYLDERTNHFTHAAFDDEATELRRQRELNESPQYETLTLQTMVRRVDRNASIIRNTPLAVLYSLGWFWCLVILAAIILLATYAKSAFWAGSFVALMLFDYYANVGIMFTIGSIVTFFVAMGIAMVVTGGAAPAGGKPSGGAPKPAAAHGGGHH